MKEIELPHTTKTNAKLIVCQENKSHITFINKSESWYYLTKVDGGVYNTITIKKCDYKLEHCETHVKYFVELKGENIKDAVPQLQSAINLLAKNETGNYAFIVFSNKSPNSATENQKIIKKFFIDNRVRLYIVRTGYKHNFDA